MSKIRAPIILPNTIIKALLRTSSSPLTFGIADLYRAFTLLIRNYIDTHGLHPRYLNTRRVSYRN
ncbi:hypothetical protein N7489_008352 [Penicillium chrysogenum]|uniref:uncharacterized protein n=1 Tax=Penicillium chrysogenum TaxID=5076 RepID=UPI0024DF098F|nr:uncharacterized protein N7489_008352 [Penicillium chrysogenum]KAJ5238261.1 hypothetical protein N7489_008352 [Penicillium chrysogenum]